MKISIKSFLLSRLAVMLVAVLIAVMLASCAGSAPIDVPESEIISTQGYKASVLESESKTSTSFLACGTGGRLDRIFADGKVENIPLPTGEKSLTSILKSDDITLVGGLSGAMVYSLDGKEFQLSEGVEKENILAMTEFCQVYYASTYSGKIFSSTDGIQWKIVKKLTDKPIIGIATNNNIIMAITSDTDIFTSVDGKVWEPQNYNKTYEGLADKLHFSNLLGFDGIFIILGNPEDSPEAPTVISTISDGEVWSSAALREINNTYPEEFYPLSVNSVAYFQGQLMGVCNGGRILTFTDCPTCNLMVETTKVDLQCISISEEILFAAGDNFEFNVLKASDLRQDNISPEQALIEMENGAYVVDVRTDEEYNTGHIPGCLHIPVDQVKDKLLEAIPDQDSVVIFYCASGGRSKTALETAQELGYQYVFNLGAISDWPYDIE